MQFAAQHEGVNSYAQAVSQARMIDRFVRADAQNKATIKKLKQTLFDMCQDFEKVDSKIAQVMQDKEQLEKIVLEILGFGDICDARFQEVTSKIEAFKK